MAVSTTTDDVRAPSGTATRPKRRGLKATEWVVLVIAAIYLLSPIDVIPEALLGPLGLTDDVVAVAILAKLGWSAIRPAEPETAS